MPATPAAKLRIGMHEVGGHTLRVGVRPGGIAQPPLLLFNGIGANIELVEPFLELLEGPAAIVFDVPGVGGSPAPALPRTRAESPWWPTPRCAAHRATAYVVRYAGCPV